MRKPTIHRCAALLRNQRPGAQPVAQRRAAHLQWRCSTGSDAQLAIVGGVRRAEHTATRIYRRRRALHRFQSGAHLTLIHVAVRHELVVPPRRTELHRTAVAHVTLVAGRGVQSVEPDASRWWRRDTRTHCFPRAGRRVNCSNRRGECVDLSAVSLQRIFGGCGCHHPLRPLSKLLGEDEDGRAGVSQLQDERRRDSRIACESMALSSERSSRSSGG